MRGFIPGGQGLLCQVDGRGGFSSHPSASCLCFGIRKAKRKKQSPERISSVLTVDDPHGSCMLKLGRADVKPRGMKRKKKKKTQEGVELIEGEKNILFVPVVAEF